VTERKKNERVIRGRVVGEENVGNARAEKQKRDKEYTLRVQFARVGMPWAWAGG